MRTISDEGLTDFISNLLSPERALHVPSRTPSVYLPALTVSSHCLPADDFLTCTSGQTRGI